MINITEEFEFASHVSSGNITATVYVSVSGREWMHLCHAGISGQQCWD